MYNMTASQDLLLSSISTYYNKSYDKRNLLDKIIHSEYKISLRVIDWFITHYTRQKRIILWSDSSGTLIENITGLTSKLTKFHIYLEYRAQLKSYTKMFFDPFRRHQRISFIISKKPFKVVETTIGQLNFFRWIFQNNILQYIEKHQEEIEEEMTKFQSIKKEIVLSDDIIKKKPSRIVIKDKCPSATNISCFLRFD